MYYEKTIHNFTKIVDFSRENFHGVFMMELNYISGMCNGLHNATNAGCPEPVVPESCKGKPLISYRPYYYKEKSVEKCYQPCPDKMICE